MHGWLPTRLRVLRAERGLTVRQVAELSGLTKETINRLETGKTHPYDRTLAKIAKAYGVPLEELLEEPVELAGGKGEAPQETGRLQQRVERTVTGRVYRQVLSGYLENWLRLRNFPILPTEEERKQATEFVVESFDALQEITDYEDDSHGLEPVLLKEAIGQALMNIVDYYYGYGWREQAGGDVHDFAAARDRLRAAS